MKKENYNYKINAMNEFLQSTVEKLTSNNFVNLTIVLGNESCDLDSAVSAIVYASFLNWQYNQLKCKLCTRKYRDEVTYKDDIFVPILNVARDDFVLKTEVTFCLKEIGVDLSLLIFRKDIDLKELITSHKTSVVLVDHHVLAKEDIFLSQYVSDIIDHRPYDKNTWNYKDDTRSTIEIVGSCTTLISIRIKELSSHTGGIEEYFENYPQSADLLHSTILLDTVNFSKEVDKATPLDVEAITFLETIMKLEDVGRIRLEKLNRLVEARRDVSQLTASQLLRKDVKIVGGIIVPSFPVSVLEFLSKDKCEIALDQYMASQQCKVVVLLGMNLDKPNVTRDLAVYYLKSCEHSAAKLAAMLETWSRPNLNLERRDTNIKNCRYYQQNNIAASRKQVMPVINEYLNLNK